MAYLSLPCLSWFTLVLYDGRLWSSPSIKLFKTSQKHISKSIEEEEEKKGDKKKRWGRKRGGGEEGGGRVSGYYELKQGREE